ncbi:MAG: glycosyltransferase [Rikenellaceae bacterium]
MEKFSVLISVYHKEKPSYLKAALESIYDWQTVRPDEIVIVKDGYLGWELDMVCDDFFDQYPSVVKIIEINENVGLGIALHIGLKHCSYNLVARMDSDDISFPYRFELQLHRFESDSSLSIVGGWINEFSAISEIVEGQRRVPQSDEELTIFMKNKSPFNHMTVMFKKDDVLRAGSYERFYLLEDYWLWGRMKFFGMKFYNIQRPLVKVRGGIDMIARRGGVKYALSEVRLQYNFYRLKIISLPKMLKNIFLRFLIRIAPTKVRSYLYRRYLRWEVG